MKAQIKTPKGTFLVDDSDFIQESESCEFGNTYTKLYMLVDIDSVVALCYARCEEYAWEDMADSGKLDRWQVDEGEVTEDEQGDVLWQGHQVTRLGNASEAFIIPHYVSMFTIPKPTLSIVALLQCQQNMVDALNQAPTQRTDPEFQFQILEMLCEFGGHYPYTEKEQWDLWCKMPQRGSLDEQIRAFSHLLRNGSCVVDGSAHIFNPPIQHGRHCVKCGVAENTGLRVGREGY